MINLKDVTSKLTGSKVTEVICGGNNGSIVVLTINNSIVLTINCVWRLSDDKEVLVSWNENNNNPESNFVLQLKSLENDLIDSLEKSIFYDLNIKFKSGKELNVLCDLNKHYSDDYFDNSWEICDKELNYCISINREHQEDVEIYNTSIV